MEARFGGIRFEGARLIFARSPAHPCANDPAENGPLLRKIGIGRTPVASNVQNQRQQVIFVNEPLNEEMPGLGGYRWFLSPACQTWLCIKRPNWVLNCVSDSLLFVVDILGTVTHWFVQLPQ